MKSAIIIHGLKGKPDTNWKPWLEEELENNGFTVEVPSMPETDRPNVRAWVQMLAHTVHNQTSDEIYLIGHSLGCITILKYLESINNNTKIKASIFVAGFTRSFKGYGGGHDSFFEKDLDWELIKKHCDQFVAVHSRDDPNVPVEELAQFEHKLGAETIVLNGFGHFGSADNVFEIPIVRDVIMKIAKQF